MTDVFISNSLKSIKVLNGNILNSTGYLTMGWNIFNPCVNPLRIIELIDDGWDVHSQCSELNIYAYYVYHALLLSPVERFPKLTCLFQWSECGVKFSITPELLFIAWCPAYSVNLIRNGLSLNRGFCFDPQHEKFSTVIDNNDFEKYYMRVFVCNTVFTLLYLVHYALWWSKFISSCLS